MLDYTTTQAPLLSRLAMRMRASRSTRKLQVTRDRASLEDACRQQVAYEAAMLERDRVIAQSSVLRIS